MKLTITQKDQTKAREYFDQRGCLVATMFAHRGYKNVRATAFQVTTNKKTFIIDSFTVIDSYTPTRTKVKKSAIGKKIKFVEP